MRLLLQLKHNQKIAAFAAFGLVAALAVTYVAVSQASHLDVNYSWINDNDVNCHPANSVVNGGVWTAEIRNNGPEDIFIEKAAFHDPVAGCSATTHTLRQDVFSMSGEINYSVGETNRTTFTFNVSAFNCGRVQVDAAYRSATGSGDGFVFLGEMINYGVDCPTTPTVETGRIRVINREVGTNADIFACWTLVRENPPQRWTDQCATTHTYENFPFGRYTIEVQPGTTHDFDHVDPVGWQNLSNGTPGGLIQWIVYWRPRVAAAPTCSGTILPQGATTTATSGTFDFVATGVANATAVNFAVWSETGGQDDIIWYPGAHVTGGDWKISANLASHPGLGAIHAHVYMNNASHTNVFCGATKLIRTAPACTTGTLQVNVTGKSDAAYFITRPDGTTFGWNGTKTFDNSPNGNYSINVPDISGFTKNVSPTSGSVNCNTLAFNITFAAVTASSLSIDKTVRNVTSGQTSFINSIGANPNDQDEVEFKIVVTSSGPNTSVVFSDQLPSRLNYVSGSFLIDGVSAGNSLTNVSLGNMSSGQTKTILLRAKLAPASQFSPGATGLTNTATVTSASSSASDTAIVTANLVPISPPPPPPPGPTPPPPPPAPPALVCSPSNQNVNVGQGVVLTAQGGTGNFGWFTVWGSPQVGNGSTFNTTFNSTGNQTVSVTSGAQSAICNVTVTSPGTPPPPTTTNTTNISNTINQSGNCNVAQVNQSGSGSSGNQANTSNVVCNLATTLTPTPTPTPTPSPTLTLVKQARNISQAQTIFVRSISANPGEQVEFRMQISSSSATASNVVLTDNLPSNFTLNFVTTDAGTFSGTTFNLGDIGAGVTRTVKITATLASESNFPSGTSQWINTASASSSNASSAFDTATVTVTRGFTTQSVGLSINKQVRNVTQSQSSFADSTTARSSDRVEFRIVITNTGNASANNVRVFDQFQGASGYNFSYVQGSLRLSGSFTNSSGDIFSNMLNLGTLGAGQSVTINFEATIPANVTSNVTLTNLATAQADNAGLVSDTANVSVSIVSGANIDIVLFKRAFNVTQGRDATTSAANPGDVIDYFLTVENRGNATATNYVIEDGLADILQLADLIQNGGGTLSGSIMRFSAQNINAGSRLEKIFSVRVKNPVPTGTDYVMSNTFGNTVNVQVRQPSIAGAFIAPKTGSSATISIILAMLVSLSVAGYKKREELFQFITKAVKP